MNIIPPRKICLSGGGIRAVAFVGALEVLNKYKLLNHVVEYIGVSAGALVGFILSIGYTLQEVKKIVLELDFGIIRNIEAESTLEFLERYGLDNGENLIRLCEAVMKQKNIPSTTTFLELSKIRPITFRCFATDLNTCTPREFSVSATPNVKILDGLRASMSLPFYFQPVQDPTTGNLLSDGGLINNYPMVFLSEEEQNHSLGMIFSCDHVENKAVEHVYDFIQQLFACVYMPRIRNIKKQLGDRTILLPNGDFPSWNFEATKEERAELIESAARATEDFLKKGNSRKPFRRYSVA